MKIFTADDIALMGDMDPEYGQTYFGSVHEQAHPVRFNMKQIVDFVDGKKFTAEESEERKAKSSGKPYTQLKKVKVVESSPTAQAEWIPEEEIQTPKVEAHGTWPDKPEEVPSYEAGTNARWAIGMAYRAYQQVMGTPEGADGEFPFEIVKQHASELVRMFNEVKKGD